MGPHMWGISRIRVYELCYIYNDALFDLVLSETMQSNGVEVYSIIHDI